VGPLSTGILASPKPCLERTTILVGHDFVQTAWTRDPDWPPGRRKRGLRPRPRGRSGTGSIPQLRLRSPTRLHLTHILSPTGEAEARWTLRTSRLREQVQRIRMHAEVNLSYRANHSPMGVKVPLAAIVGDTIPPALPCEGMGSDVITIRRTRLHHDGVTGRTAILYLSADDRPPIDRAIDRARRTGTEQDGHSATQDWAVAAQGIRLTELAAPTDRANDPDQRRKENLSLFLSTSLHVRRASLGRVIRLGKGHRSTNRFIVHPHSKACNSPNCHEHPDSSNIFDRPPTERRARLPEPL
jgi:hypothetical protein